MKMEKGRCAMLNVESFKCGARSSVLLLIIVSALLLISVGVFAQTTISTGSIVGTVRIRVMPLLATPESRSPTKELAKS